MTTCFYSCACFFNMATLTKHSNLRIESYFFIFCVFDFVVEKMIKNAVKTLIQKKHQNIATDGPPNAPKINENPSKRFPKFKQFAKKMIFGGVDFLMIFWVAKKALPRGHSHLWPPTPSPPGLLWGVGGNNITPQFCWLSKLPAASRRSGPGDWMSAEVSQQGDAQPTLG